MFNRRNLLGLMASVPGLTVLPLTLIQVDKTVEALKNERISLSAER